MIPYSHYMLWFDNQYYFYCLYNYFRWLGYDSLYDSLFPSVEIITFIIGDSGYHPIIFTECIVLVNRVK
jgi:hypothetical protein